MKYQYGSRSLKILAGADVRLQQVFHTAIKLGLIDITILESHRTKAKQNKLFKMGKSKVQWPDGKHNTKPSLAIDAAPYINGKASFDYRHCIYLAGIVCAVGVWLGVDIRWGGCWSGKPEDIANQSFNDLVHYEIKD